MTFRHYVAGLALVCMLVGCEPQQPNPAPHNVVEYNKMDRTDRRRWPDALILSLNLSRVQSDELSEKDRLSSLRLVEHLGIADPEAAEELSTVVRDSKNPPALRQAVAAYLNRTGQGDVPAHAVATLPSPGTPVASAMPTGQTLSGIVLRWVAEPADGPREAEYRKLVQSHSAKAWDDTLLESLNDPDFAAKSEAMELLQARVPANLLKQKLLALPAKTATVSALQTFAETFGYLPPSREAFVSATVLYKARRDMISDAARLAGDWQRSYGYPFDVRDFHLLSRLARDPLRTNLKKTQLTLDVGKAVKTRRHVRRAGLSDNFWLAVDKLTMADLWNLYLLNEMLKRPRVQTSLRLMADSDLADRNSAWGGLVFYQNGQAEAHLYPSNKTANANDVVYQPTSRLITDGRDALCRFNGHFERVDNTSRVGPTAGELASARQGDYYGLILTRTGPDRFVAHYYNPNGTVVSLGEFPLR